MKKPPKAGEIANQKSEAFTYPIRMIHDNYSFVKTLPENLVYAPILQKRCTNEIRPKRLLVKTH